MDDGEFVLGILGLFLGLTITELLSKASDLIDARKRITFGWLAPLLACVIVLSMMSTWLGIYWSRASIQVSWYLVAAVVVLASSWYLAVSMVFPRNISESLNLNDHYWKNKNWILTLQITVGLLSEGYREYAQFSAALPWTNNFTIGLLFGIVPLAILRVSRSEVLDGALLLTVITYYLQPWFP